MAEVPVPEHAHRWPVRVYYEDTDAAGIVYHAQYLCFAERARTEFLRAMGQDHRRLRDEHGIVFALRRLSIDFARPARLDDRLEVVTVLERMRGARVRFDQAIARGAETVAALRIELAIVGPDLRPRRLPRTLERLFAAWTTTSSQQTEP